MVGGLFSWWKLQMIWENQKKKNQTLGLIGDVLNVHRGYFHDRFFIINGWSWSKQIWRQFRVIYFSSSNLLIIFLLVFSDNKQKRVFLVKVISIGEMEKKVCGYYLMKTENSFCIHESLSLLLVSCKYLYKHLFSYWGFCGTRNGFPGEYSPGEGPPSTLRAPGEPRRWLITEQQRCLVIQVTHRTEQLMSA